MFKGAPGATAISQPNTFNLVDIQFHFNESNNNADFRADGQTVDNLIYMDASADAIGINTNSPVVDLDVNNGSMGITSNTSGTYELIMYEPSTDGNNYSSFSPASQTYNLDYSLPEWFTETDYSILCNDGTGDLEWADMGIFAQYLRAPVITIDTPSSTYTATEDDQYIIVDNANTPFYVYLPPASEMDGKEFFVKKTLHSGQSVYVTPVGTDTIDGNATPRILLQNFEAILLVSDGTEWYIMATYGQ
jgi:hypothetical protein